MDELKQALIDGALQMIAAAVAMIPVAAGVAYAWLRNQARQIAEDAEAEAEETARIVGMSGEAKRALAVSQARARMPRVKGVFAPSDTDIGLMVDKASKKAAQRKR